MTKVIISEILKKGDLVTIKPEYYESLGIKKEVVEDVFTVRGVEMSKNHKTLLLKLGAFNPARERILYEVTSDMVNKFGEMV